MNDWVNQRNLPTSSFKCALTPSVFYDFYVEPSSRYRLVHILPASSSKPASDAPVVFLTSFMWNRARATVSCTFFRPHLPKVSRGRQFFTFLFFAHCQRVDRALNPNVEETKNVGCEKTIFWSHASPPPFFMVFSSPCPALNELVPCRKYEQKLWNRKPVLGLKTFLPGSWNEKSSKPCIAQTKHMLFWRCSANKLILDNQ